MTQFKNKLPIFFHIHEWNDLDVTMYGVQIFPYWCVKLNEEDVNTYVEFTINLN